METLQKLFPIFRTTARPPPPQQHQPNTNPTTPQNPTPPTVQQQPQPQPQPSLTPLTSARSLRQLSLFALGSTLFLLSTTLTRRAIHRRTLRLKPSFYAPNTNPHEHFSPLHDAAQALNLATLNCLSLGTMGVGGTLWALDIEGLEEARSVLRGRLGYDVIYRESGGEPPRGVFELLLAAGETVVVEEGKGEKKSEER